MTNQPYRRARRTFWTLVLFAVLLIGLLSRALQTPPSPRTGVAVAVLGALTVIVIALAARLLLALTGRLPPATVAQDRLTTDERSLPRSDD